MGMYMELKDDVDILREVARKNIKGFSQLIGMGSEVKGLYSKQFQDDVIYLLDDGTLLNIEFQTSGPEKSTMNMIKYYSAALQYNTNKTVKSLIVCSGMDLSREHIDNLMQSTDFFPKWFLFKQHDADKILSNIYNKIENNIGINSLDCCNLSLILLFGSNRRHFDVISDAFDIVFGINSISFEQKENITNIQYMFADKFLSKNEREKIGIKHGKAKATRKIAKNLLDGGYSIEEISKVTGLSIDEINNL